MLVFLLAATLALFVVGVALPQTVAAAPAFWAHLVLGVGVMTLITAAMQHFVPVLTRGRGAGVWLARLPWLMLVAGVLASLVFLGILPGAVLSAAAALALFGVGVMLVWMRGMTRRCLGPAHPGLAWYGAALVCLGLGLLTVPAMQWWPAAHGALRAFHFHINLYGFVGLTAIGTLQVLLPTAAGKPDPGVAIRLRQDLKWALIGAVSIAFGQAGVPGLAGLGVAAWAWPLLRLALAWLRLYGRDLFRLHGNLPVLAAALLGYAGALVTSLDGGGRVEGPLTVFLPGFLFALVSGAAAQLAPVWLGQGADSAVHRAGQIRLARYGGVRALLFLCSALLPVLGYRCAGMPGLTALFWFLILFAIWLYRD